MIILRETLDAQDLNIIARANDIDRLTFTDEQSKEVFSVLEVDFIDAGYYITDSLVLDFLKEDHTYRMRAYAEQDVSFNSLVFVTNQDVVDNVGVYSINDNEYNTTATNNEYKIYE